MSDPILEEAAPHVAPVAAITKPQGTTLQDTFAYFHCSMATASLFRKDGKRIPFLNHLHKTNIKEDIQYLRDEIEQGIMHLKELVTDGDINTAEASIDPRGAMEKQIRAKILAEMEAAGVQVPKQVSQQQPSGVSTQTQVDAANADAKRIEGIDAASAAAAKLAQLRNQQASTPANPLNPAAGTATLTPVSSADIASAAAGSNGAPAAQ